MIPGQQILDQVMPRRAELDQLGVPENPNLVGLFEGYGGLTMGVQAVTGGRLIAYSEIEPSSIRLLTKHFPDVPNLGDITEIDWKAMRVAANRKLNPDQVLSAIEMYESGMSLAPIAKYFEVSRQAMWDLLRRRTTMRQQKRQGVENHFYRGTVADQRAHDIVEKAILAGRLIRPEICEVCGGSGEPFSDGRYPLQAHHDDYNKPLDVRWLCQRDHHEWHRTNTAIPVAGGDANGSLSDIDVLFGGFP